MKLYGNSIVTVTKVISVGDHETAGFAVKKSKNLSLVNRLASDKKEWKEAVLSVAEAGKKYFVRFRTNAPLWVRIQSCDGIQNTYHIMTVKSIPNYPYCIPITSTYDACMKLCIDNPGVVSDISFAKDDAPYTESDNVVVALPQGYPLRGNTEARDYFDIGESTVTYTQCVDVENGKIVALAEPVTTRVTDGELVAALLSLRGEERIESTNCIRIGGIEE